MSGYSQKWTRPFRSWDSKIRCISQMIWWIKKIDWMIFVWANSDNNNFWFDHQSALSLKFCWVFITAVLVENVLFLINVFLGLHLHSLFDLLLLLFLLFISCTCILSTNISCVYVFITAWLTSLNRSLNSFIVLFPYHWALKHDAAITKWTLIDFIPYWR